MIGVPRTEISPDTKIGASSSKVRLMDPVLLRFGIICRYAWFIQFVQVNLSVLVGLFWLTLEQFGKLA